VNGLSAPTAALQRLPGWEDATCELLPGGLSNRGWLLQKDGRRAVLKIDDGPRMPPFNTRKQEAIIQTAAADASLANAVLYEGDGLFLTAYVEGEVWSAASFEQHRNLELLARALRRVHSLPPAGRTFDAAGAAQRYASAIEFDEGLIARCVGIVDGVGLPREIRLCHNDLVAENILATPAIRLLDWEYACDNDPLFDLATVVEHHGLGARQSIQLLDTYFDGDGKTHQAALREQQRLYSALLWLWLAARPDTTQQELRQAAERLTTSCS
jgi:thiamine kinase-like enzyme